jgi:hypothetical protein
LDAQIPHAFSDQLRNGRRMGRCCRSFADRSVIKIKI